MSACLACLACLALPRAASANGRFPAAGLFVVDPNDPAHLFTRTTYGLLTTRDGGGSWSWICEGALGIATNEDPMVGVLSDGTLILSLFLGLSKSADGGCTWAFEGGGLADRTVVDLSVDRVDPSKAVALVSEPVDAVRSLTQLWETNDSGRTWAQAGVDLPESLSALTVDTAPSDPSRVYVTGRVGAPTGEGVIVRSPDRGRTWESLSIAGSDDKSPPYLSAIAPDDPDTLYVRVDGEADSLLVSRDAGQGFTQVFQAQGNLLGFALSPDGSTVAIGGNPDGLWRAPVSTLQFEKVSNDAVQCLTWADAGLFACGDEASGGFAGGVSVDKGDPGRSFVPVLRLDDLCGSLACDPGTTVASICEPLWPAMKRFLNAASCDGAGGGGGSGGDGVAASPETPSGGCGCRLSAGDGRTVAPEGRLAALAAAALFVVRRRRRSASG